jgi:hypothetical protein
MNFQAWSKFEVHLALDALSFWGGTSKNEDFELKRRFGLAPSGQEEIELPDRLWASLAPPSSQNDLMEWLRRGAKDWCTYP